MFKVCQFPSNPHFCVWTWSKPANGEQLGQMWPGQEIEVLGYQVLPAEVGLSGAWRLAGKTDFGWINLCVNYNRRKTKIGRIIWYCIAR